MKLPWLVTPSFDLAFLCGWIWLLVLIPGAVTAEASTPLHFWQIYFLTTPHRWLTIFLVATDPDRRQEKTKFLVGLAALLGLATAGIYFGSGAFLCLALVDFLWNGWHFASQHAGILAVYGKRVGSYRPLVEKFGLRLFLAYVIFRSAGWTTGYLDSDSGWTRIVESLDWLMAGLLAGIWLAQAPSLAIQMVPKLAYLLSVSILYLGLLVSLHWRSSSWTMRFALASAILHATEYLAIVSVYAWKRREVGSAGLFREMARRWVPLLFLFVLAIGFIETNLGQALGEVWIGLNLWASFVHYAFDGLIWKLRHAATARALGSVT